jgi:hypothetical protein
VYISDMEMRRTQSPAEAALQEKFQNHDRKVNLTDLGFIQLLNGEFMVLANQKTGETLVEMYKAGKLPGDLITSVGPYARVGEELSIRLVETAYRMTPDRFHRFAKELGIPEAEDLWLFSMRYSENSFHEFAHNVSPVSTS